MLKSAEGSVTLQVTQGKCIYINIFVMNGLSHHYYLGNSSFILWGFRSDFKSFLGEIPLNSAASHLGQ